MELNKVISLITKLFVLLLILAVPVYAADRVKVEALSDFSTLNPAKTFSVRLVEDSEIQGLFMLQNDILNCSVQKITDPKRAKQDAKIYLKVLNYVDKKGVHNFNDNLRAKYAKTVVNKEEIKKIPPKKVVTKTAGTVGSFFVKGFSYGVSFVDGIVTNEEDNRLKSGVKQVYDDSFLSLIEKGQEVEIKQGDIFYLIIKTDKEED